MTPSSGADERLGGERVATASDDAAFADAAREQLPKRPDRTREGPSPDLSSHWWSSLSNEADLAERLAEVLHRAERELVDIPTPRRPGRGD
jgi:hypothetical protein